MERELQQPLSVPELAAGVNLSASRLIHLFRAETGLPPARYLRELRLRRARADLEQTFLSVKQIMFAAGFTDPSHFSRTFKRHYGVSPAAIRPRAARTRRRAGGDPQDPGEEQELPRVSRIGPQSRGTADDRRPVKAAGSRYRSAARVPTAPGRLQARSTYVSSPRAATRYSRWGLSPGRSRRQAVLPRASRAPLLFR
jgi:AraC-like DNA-binding protein